MSGRKGMPHYTEGTKEQLRQEHDAGASVTGLSRKYGITPSMSRRGNCLDNAMAENFFSILKTECIYPVKPKTIAHAQLLIDEFIHFYNCERIQLKTGLAPLDVRNQPA